MDMRTYVFHNEFNEYQWTVVAHTPIRIEKGKKFYLIGGVRDEDDGTHRFKTGELPYRIDRKNQSALGRRVAFEDLPAVVLKFIEATF